MTKEEVIKTLKDFKTNNFTEFDKIIDFIIIDDINSVRAFYYSKKLNTLIIVPSALPFSPPNREVSIVKGFGEYSINEINRFIQSIIDDMNDIEEKMIIKNNSTGQLMGKE